MDPQSTIDLSREALTMVGIIGGPILAAGLVIGLIVGIFQAMTQIQDQTVSAVPKILGMLLVTMMVLPWLGERMIDYTRETLSTPMIGGYVAQTPPADSPFTLASATTRLNPDLQIKSAGPVARVAANLPLVPPPLKPSMPIMTVEPSSMPIHPFDQNSQSPAGQESSMPQLRGGNLGSPSVVKSDLEG